MMTINDLREKWESISPYTGGYLLVNGDHPLSFHIGYRTDVQKSFVVLNTGMQDKIESSKAITTEYITTGKDVYSLRFSLNYPSLDEIFVKLCWDLIDSSRDTDNPVEAILKQYKKWLRLLQLAGSEVLSPSLQKGLLGELLYFNYMLKTMNPWQVLNAWVGPEGSDQDFIFSKFWAEVKAVSAGADDVQISSLQQLDCSSTGFLVVYFLDKTSSTGIGTISLPEVVMQAKAGLPNVRDKDEFSCKLVKYGYLDKDISKYQETRFRFAEERYYKVDDTFPRLSRAHVTPAIVSVQYRLSLSMIESYKVPEV